MKIIFLVICSFSILLAAQERPEKGRSENSFSPEKRRIDGRKRDQGHKPGQRMKAYMEKLKTTDPKEYERLLKLQESDVAAFREEIFKIVRPKKDFKRGKGHPSNWMEKLQKENPEKYKKLHTMREQSPEKFREQMRKEIGERLHSSKQGHDKPKDYSEIRKLIQDYHEASEDKKEAMKQLIRVKLKEQVEIDLKRQVERSQKMEEYLKSINKQIKERQANIDPYIDGRLERILSSGKIGKHEKPGRGEKKR